MATPEHDDACLAALIGGPGIDASLNGSGDPKSAWQLAEGLGLAQPARRSIDLLSTSSTVFERLEGSALGALVLRLDWSRLEPSEGALDQEAVGAWSGIAHEAKERGLGVTIVLSGGVLPAWMGPEGWLLPATPERFAHLAGTVADAMGEAVDGIVTLEAPARFALCGWMLGLAPPFRRAALRDALAALDGMLAGHLLALGALEEQAGSRGCSIIPSASLLGELEAALLGTVTHQLPAWLGSLVAGLSPGRARQLADEVTEPWGTEAWAVVGRGAGPTGGIAGSLLEVASGASTADADEVARSLHVARERVEGGAVHLLWRRRVAVIDEQGRRRVAAGSPLLDAAGPVIEGITRFEHSGGGPVASLVVGELVDRWEMGSYETREGILGVEHRPGDEGSARLLATDAAGEDALGALGDLTVALKRC
jgi:hypothetical protein